MYEQFYDLRERPFDLTPNPRYLVATEAHQEALSNLQYAIASRKGVTLLVGEAGTGKTTVIRAALERQTTKVHYVHLHNPALTRLEFVEMIATRFALSSRARQSKTALLLEFEQLLRHRRQADETTVLILDEAQSLPVELLEEVRLLTNIETDSEKLVTLVIAGQPEIADRLNDASLRQLKQRIALRCELKPLSHSDAVAYVARRIVAAGGTPAQLFSREAVLCLVDRANGIPRTINVIADNALLSGFAAGHKPVRADLVREVCRDFDIGPRQAHEAREPQLAPASPASHASQTLSARDKQRLDSIGQRTPHLAG
jgi:type II secretory pathway predicted ATPase ExeA